MNQTDLLLILHDYRSRLVYNSKHHDSTQLLPHVHCHIGKSLVIITEKANIQTSSNDHNIWFLEILKYMTCSLQDAQVNNVQMHLNLNFTPKSVKLKGMSSLFMVASRVDSHSLSLSYTPLWERVCDKPIDCLQRKLL